MTNPLLNKLHPYPFEKLNKARQGLIPNPELNPIALGIGEPKHQPPQFVLDTLVEQLASVSQYPNTKGSIELREAIAQWLIKRFHLPAVSINADEHILPVNGTREALFAFTQAIIDASKNPLVVSPNPFYQIYEGAALLAGAELQYINATEATNYQADFSDVTEQQWQRCQLLFLCSPGNPSGQLVNSQQYQELIELSDRYHFTIVSDECYSELYRDEDNAPVGLLEVCAQMGRDDYKNCMVFHSLSKRSNLPGLRSGFVAGDKALIKQFLLYRTYHGCAMSLPTQMASTIAWQDEAHVYNNRQQYREKYAIFGNTLDGTWDIPQPPASFYLWAKTPIDDVEFAKKLYVEQNISVLPGSFLGREVNGINPGKHHIRMALVAPVEECQDAANRLKTFIQSL